MFFRKIGGKVRPIEAHGKFAVIDERGMEHGNIETNIKMDRNLVNELREGKLKAIGIKKKEMNVSD